MTTGFDVFDRTVHKSLRWLDELALELQVDRQGAYRLLRAVLHALRDRLTVVEAVELGAQMPMLLRGLYFDGWSPSGKPARFRRLVDLVARVRHELPPSAGDELARAAIAAVFRVLDRHISAGELADVRHCLPRALRDAWPGS
jgi:uncharacterized protein (DUF2267 family)